MKNKRKNKGKRKSKKLVRTRKCEECKSNSGEISHLSKNKNNSKKKQRNKKKVLRKRSNSSSSSHRLKRAKRIVDFLM